MSNRSLCNIQGEEFNKLFPKIFSSKIRHLLKNDLWFEKNNQSIGFQLIRVSYDDASMTFFIQFIFAVFTSMHPRNTSKVLRCLIEIFLPFYFLTEVMSLITLVGTRS